VETRSHPGGGPIAFTANIHSERGAQARGVFSVVRHQDRCGPSRKVLKFEGRYADPLYSFTSDDVFQLDRDIPTALVTIRQWRNSFVHINRIPSEVLSLIPTHLGSHRDRLRATFVCRRWRRTFLQDATSWTRLILLHGAAYVKTILERAKGSALDIIATHADPVSAIMLLPPHNKQIKCLYFEYSYWPDIQRFSEIDSGPFPLIRILLINAVKELNPGSPPVMTPPSLPLFGNAVNLDELSLHSEGSPSLNHFVFPSLTAFELSATPAEGFRVSQLPDFLQASPMLQKVHMKIISDILLEGVPQAMVVTLPNLENLHLAVTDGGPVTKPQLICHVLT